MTRIPALLLRTALTAIAIVATSLSLTTMSLTPAQAAEPVGTMTKVDFIAASVAPAQQSQKDYGVPASVTIAQAILESGWGKSGLAAQNKNYFGIKCFNNVPGPIATGCQSWSTYECLPTCLPTTATFRAYATVTDSFRDHALFLRSNSRYRPAFSFTNDADSFLYQMWAAGYATSPTYVANVGAVMKTYNLYRYDLPVQGVSMDGDPKAELTYVDAQGIVRTFRNVNGLAGFPYPQAPIAVGYGFDPARTFFADLNGDGRAEILAVDAHGAIKAFRNVNGLTAFPYPQAPVPVAYGFDPARTFFPDVDGDGRADLVAVDAKGVVRAWRNINGLDGFPYPQSPVVIGNGFDPARMRFADIDGDKRDEIVNVDVHGTVYAWRNVNGFDGFPYPQSPATVGLGFDPARMRFADIDGDGRDEVAAVDGQGVVRAFRNVNGLAAFPYPQAPVVVGLGFDPARMFLGQ
jgi:flagellum-specific peptidoglycan hydrolase FlgJ